MVKFFCALLVLTVSHSALAHRHFSGSSCRQAILYAVKENLGLSKDKMAEKVGEVYQAHKAHTSEIAASWEPAAFTDPAKHSENFKYLVVPLEETKSAGKILFFPRKLNGLPGVMGSVISHEKPTTSTSWGFIIEPNIGIIMATSSGDTGKPIANAVEMERRTTMYGIKNSTVLLNYTAAGTPNRVDLGGSQVTGNYIHVTGLFIKVDRNGTPKVPASFVEDMKATAEIRSIPLIFIP